VIHLEACKRSNALTRLNTTQDVANNQTLTFTHFGRKSGKPYEVMLAG